MNHSRAYGIRESSDDRIKRLIRERELKQHIVQALEQIITPAATAKD